MMIWIFSIYSYATLIGSNFSQSDLQVLEDFNIKSSYITDYKLQEDYKLRRNKRNSHNYIENLTEASLFVPKVKDVLREQNIPDVFIYMAMAESNFDIEAKSNVQATGLWQFMDGTAKRYNLRIDPYVDERMDLVKSTVAASKYLDSLHRRFDKWYLAAIAYNCGEGRMIEAITRATIDLFVEKFPSQEKTAKIKSYREIIKNYQEKKIRFSQLNKVYKKVRKWNIKPDIEDLMKVQEGFERQYIPRESRNYLRKILSLAMMNSQDFITNKENSDLLDMGISTTVATVKVKGGLHIKNIAKAIGMKHKELYALNKHLKRMIIPPTDKYYAINLPYSRLAVYNENKNKIKDTKFAIHTVKSGDTLSGIAHKYKITIKEIRKQNKLKTDLLSLKQNLLLPIPSDMIGQTNLFGKSSKRKVSKVAKKKTKKRKTVTHIVKSGDTLSSIAEKYKVTMKEIRKKNKLKSDVVRLKQKLLISTSANKVVKKTKSNRKYIVKSGDTLSTIARKYKVTMKKLMKDNNLKSKVIKIGVRLVIK